jgi:serine/threonine protein kinase
MRGGELFDKIRQEKSLSERESAKIMHVIIKTIEQLHRNSIGKIYLFLFIKLKFFLFSTS